MDWNDHFGVDIFDVINGFRDFAPGGRNGDAENFGTFDWRLGKGITWVGYNIINNNTDIFARDLVGDNGGVVFAKEGELETV